MERQTSRLPELTRRAKELLAVRHATMATVNVDGSPHNSPYFFMTDPELEHLYWGSHPESLHSQNILRTGQLFVVLYDAMDRGGLYIKAEGGHVLTGAELDAGLAVHNAKLATLGKPPIAREYYDGGSQQKMWGAQSVGYWVNAAERDAGGMIIRDYRYEVRREDLL